MTNLKHLYLFFPCNKPRQHPDIQAEEAYAYLATFILGYLGRLETVEIGVPERRLLPFTEAFAAQVRSQKLNLPFKFAVLEWTLVLWSMPMVNQTRRRGGQMINVHHYLRCQKIPPGLCDEGES